MDRVQFISYLSIVILVVSLLPFGQSEKNSEDVWEQDMSDAFQIDPSTQGLQRVHLRCGAESMHVELETEREFTGVMYTRGSFYKQSGPCFVKPEQGRQTRKLSMNFALNQCQTVEDDDVFSNVVIVQHEPDLVMPGDAAFAVECDYRQPRTFTLNADMQARDREAFGSRITLTSPDPAAAPSAHGEMETVHSDTDEVTFTPGSSSKNVGEQKVRGTVESVSRDEL